MMAEIEAPDMALPWVIKNVLPPGLSGLMFVAVIAALQSTLDSALNSTSLLITRDIRGVLVTNPNPENDLKIGRYLTLVILLCGMLAAPVIDTQRGIYVFIQTMLSLFQGPTLALLILGVLTRHVSAKAGIIVLLSGVLFSAVMSWQGVNLLWVAFISFIYAMVALWGLSYLLPNRESKEDLDQLVFTRA